jgi:hypothetical protein
MSISWRVLILFLIGCSKASNPAPEPPAAPSGEAPRPAAPSAPAAAAPDGPSAGGLTWSAGAPFVKRAPKSSMRVAEYGVEGDDSAELAVFYFGADQGGSVEDNMTRWISQFKQPDGSETKAKRGQRTVKDVDVSVIEATGTYSGGMAMPGAPPQKELAEAGLLGAIAKGPEGSVFFKLTGSKAGVDSARSAFDGLIESLRKVK